MDITAHLAQTLKALRQQKNWSLTQAAQETGVSKAMLGQIERNESSPTVATLWKIATGFNVPFSAFITPPAPGARTVFDAQQTMLVEPLFPWDEQLRFDMLAVTLAPGAQSDSTPHERGVTEHVVVIEGELELQTDGVWRRLGPGEGLKFAGDRPHAYRNATSLPVRFHSLIHYPAP
ncbi:helix-turn-helix transcriptional regulator [Cronobacter sakazakii]|uniref:helix-turn-helix domain-containing protein n=1 Tax=Cronobacter sakazakii TaxID=28141 RepID=UPI000CFBD9D4|nr:XRE family transcriptional regulator [Cronobacter sakazakii]ELY2471311.1 helix-turn-helix transcriptional regulator [Cronobacter sakazakii]ELY2857821.1 helix-turn-helix transcriptional regulator [Cronobacter sakazakii]ELY3411718.1 helix-turn-helix transcriptional regulator [Cronobacter sakazakii]ELY4417393.1 helix-turn-helix transcriptional regulator [Cronobacter sakazakii]ELY4749352.1 helix-turn-helix transcriptional regulator [Cronobacter sakazakii]